MSSPKNSIEKGRHEGRKEGREEGILIGQELGIKIGEEMGKIEGKVEVAKNLLKAGISIDIISQTTNLSHDEIKQLQEDSAP
uniref:hypothetical protein n=1 Tax=Candidatus Wolbachia massiliensis TaxID=1845000 RepID=UPI0037BF5986